MPTQKLTLREKVRLNRLNKNTGAMNGKLFEYAKPADRRVTFADLKIRTKEKKLVAFKPNDLQVKYLDALTEAHPGFRWREGIYDLSGIREDILKARQQGMSTLWLAIYFCDTINNPLTQTIIVAHDAPSTEKMFKVIHRFWENLPAHKKRPKKFSSKREIEFKDNESVIYVGTAGGEGVGRGGTLNNLHLSEFAFWKNADAELGLLESVPSGGNATRETTANGLNHYYDERMAQKNGESNFVPRFFGWHENPEYKVALEEVPLDFERTPDEIKIADAYNLDNQQLVWRRQKIKDLKGKFDQEYPISESVAFLSSGNPYFSRDKLTEISHDLQGPQGEPLPVEIVLSRLIVPRLGTELKPLLHPTTGRPVANVEATQKKWAILRGAIEQGKVLVYKLPTAKMVYTIGADCAEGVDQHDSHDFDSADVIDCARLEQVAALHGKWDTHTYGILLAQLGWFYNTALVGVEHNNHGEAVLNSMVHHAHYPANPEDYSKGVFFRIEANEQKKPNQRKWGWWTGKHTKYFALDLIETALQENALILHSRETVNELLKFVKLAGGKAGADGRGHDDRVMSLSIAMALTELRPRSWAQNRGMLQVLKEHYAQKTADKPGKTPDVLQEPTEQDLNFNPQGNNEGQWDEKGAYVQNKYPGKSSKENPDCVQDLLAEMSAKKPVENPQSKPTEKPRMVAKSWEALLGKPSAKTEN